MSLAKKLVLLVLPALPIAAAAFFWFAGGETVSALEVPRTENFPATLLAAEVYDETVLADLVPSDDFVLYDLESSLFTDDADKQRLISLPAGTQLTVDGDGLPIFPDGTTIAKTFSYPVDARDPGLGNQIIETRLLVLTEGEWNVATYRWNDEQTDAALLLEGAETEMSWIDPDGVTQTVDYEIPTENQCVSCHQASEHVTPIGPELQNLNFDIERDGQTINQLTYLSDVGFFDEIEPDTIGYMVNYFDDSIDIAERARAYLDMNCAHCHNSEGWTQAANRGLDLEWATAYDSTGIGDEGMRILRQFSSGQMPLMGTSVVDDEGLAILREYLGG